MPENRKKRNIKVKNETPKKKKKNTLKRFFKNIKKISLETFKNDSNDIKSENKTNLELVKGNRKKKLTQRIVLYSIICAVIITVLVINFLTPTGLIEKMQNDYATSGNGEYPVNIYAQNPDEFISNGDVSLLLNGTYLEVYNKKGKLVNAASHGMFEPQIKVSQARFLLFDRDRYSVKIYNYSNELYERTFDKNIICADIGRDGTYAVVTTSDTHNNTVTVYNKKNDLVYTWNSADNYCIDVAVSDDGDSIAVCLVDALSGSYLSKVYILQYDSATPVWKGEFNTFLSSISSVNKEYFLITGVDSSYTVNWKGGYNEVDLSGEIRYYSVDFSGYSSFCYGREDNEYENNIVIIGEDGSKLSEFKVFAPVSDIDINETRVAVLSSDTVFVYDFEGSLLKTLKSDTKPLFVSLTSDNNVVVSDNTQLKLLVESND